MTRDEILSIYRTHLAAEQRHDHESAAATYLEHGYYRVMAADVCYQGRAAVAAQYAMSYATVPDMRFEIEHEVVEGNQLFHSGTARGTATTGRSIALPFAARYEFADGAMLGETLWYDLATFAEQAGVTVEMLRDAARGLAAQYSPERT